MILNNGFEDEEHEDGNEHCTTCWTNPFKCICGGLIHNAFGDENYDDYWLYEKCDKCGDDYEKE